MIETQKIITCPRCQKRLQVNNAKMVPEKIISCPSCQTKLQVKFEKRDVPQQPVMQPIYHTPQQPAEKETQYPGMPPAGGYAGQPQMPDSLVQQPMPNRSATSQGPKYKIGHLECMGRTYQLKPGRNTVGRAATTNDAMVQIFTGTDNTMSRLHAIINVVQTENGYGATIKHYEGATNATTIDGKTLTKYDEPFLKPGQIIRMGLMEVRYVAEVEGGFQQATQPVFHPQQPPQYQQPQQPAYQQPQHPQQPPQYQPPQYQPPQYQPPQQPQRPPMPPRPPQWGAAPRRSDGDETIY